MFPASDLALVDPRFGERVGEQDVVRRPRLEGRFSQRIIRGTRTLTVEAGLPFLVSLRERRRVAVKFGGICGREAGRGARGINHRFLVTRVLVDARYSGNSHTFVCALRRRRVLGDARLLRGIEEIPQLRVEVALLARAAAHGGRVCSVGAGVVVLCGLWAAGLWRRQRTQAR